MTDGFAINPLETGTNALSPAAARYLAQTFALSGKVALVTGAREGIGAAVAVVLATAGARVAVTSRRAERLQPVVEEVERAGSEALPLAMEARDLQRVRTVVARTAEHFGRLDILVNNAGIAIRRESLTYTAAEFDEVVEVNLRACFFAAQAAADVMIGGGEGGAIVNLSSVFAHKGMANRAAYAASKAALEQMTRVLAVEWAVHGIRVNAVAPATVLTPTREHLFPTRQALEERLKLIPLGRLGTPEDIAPAVLFLASGAASWITGATLLIDGGMSI